MHVHRAFSVALFSQLFVKFARLQSKHRTIRLSVHAIIVRFVSSFGTTGYAVHCKWYQYFVAIWFCIAVTI